MIAAELRTPALLPARNSTKPNSNSSAQLRGLGTEHQRAAHRRHLAGRYFRRASESSAYARRNTCGRGQSPPLSTKLKAFQAKYYGPAHMTLGGRGRCGRRCGHAGRNRQGILRLDGRPGLSCGRAKAAAAAAPPQVYRCRLPDKPSVIGDARSSDRTALQGSRRLPLRVGTAILGRGFTGRLMGTRARQGRPDLQHRREHGR